MKDRTITRPWTEAEAHRISEITGYRYVKLFNGNTVELSNESMIRTEESEESYVSNVNYTLPNGTLWDDTEFCMTWELSVKYPEGTMLWVAYDEKIKHVAISTGDMRGNKLVTYTQQDDSGRYANLEAFSEDQIGKFE